MTQPLTQPEFEEKVANKTNHEIICLDNYKGRRYIHSFKHVTCGKVFPATPDNIYQNKHNCPRCRRLRKTLTFKMKRGHVSRLVEVRCKHMHRFHIDQSKVKAYYKGKVECPICKKLAVLDPRYKDALVDFSWEMRGGLI